MYAPLDRKLQKLLSKENIEKLTQGLFKNSQVSSGRVTVLRTLERRLSDHCHLVLRTLKPRLCVPPGPSWYSQDPSLQFFRNQMAEFPATSEKSKHRGPSASLWATSSPPSSTQHLFRTSILVPKISLHTLAQGRSTKAH